MKIYKIMKINFFKIPLITMKTFMFMYKGAIPNNKEHRNFPRPRTPPSAIFF